MAHGEYGCMPGHPPWKFFGPRIFFFSTPPGHRVLSLHPPLRILGVQKFFCTKPFRKVHSELSPHTSGRRARSSLTKLEEV